MSSLLPPEISVLATTNYEQTAIFKPWLEEQSQKIKKENRTLDQTITNLYVCHATYFFPKNGVITPRCSYHVAVTSMRLKNVITKLFSLLRPTVHFSLNSVVSEHSDYLKLSPRPRIFVIEKFINAKERIVGGYLEDLFCIGPYPLSPEATILVPESLSNDPSLKNDIGNLKNGKVVYYKGDEDNAVSNWLQTKGASVFKPIESDPDSLNFFYLSGKKHYVSSHSLMKNEKKVHCSHDVTPTAQIERLIINSPIKANGETGPFSKLPSQYSYKEISQLIKGYVQSTKEVYLLNPDQISYMDNYEKSALEIVKGLYLAKTISHLEKTYNALCPEDKIEVEQPEEKKIPEVNFEKPVAQEAAKNEKATTTFPSNAPKVEVKNYLLKQRCKENKSGLILVPLFFAVCAILGSYSLSTNND